MGLEVFLDFVYGKNDKFCREGLLIHWVLCNAENGCENFPFFCCWVWGLLCSLDLICLGFVRVQLLQRLKWRRKWLRGLLKKEEEEGVRVVLLDLVLLVAFALSWLFLVLGERHFLGFGGSALLPVSVPSWVTLSQVRLGRHMQKQRE